MKSLIFSAWLRRSVGFWFGLALILTGLFSWSTMPAEAASRSSVRARQASVQKNRIKRKAAKVRSQRRWIKVDLSSQRLVAYEGGRPVYSTRISSGKRSTPTLTGTYSIQNKLRSTRMRGRDYNVPNVPYAMFYSGNYAIHGAYWHNRFGTRVSHGCVNLPVSQARKLYNWASPGTKVVIRQ